MEKFDVVIAGAGIGGLVCGALLAKKGIRVAIFEKENKAGGYCSSFSQNGYSFDACVDSIGCLSKGGILREALNGLQVWDGVELIQLNPIRRNIFPELTIDIPGSSEQYQDTLRNLFPREADGIRKLFTTMNDIYQWSNDSALSESSELDLQPWISRTFKSLLEEYVDDTRLQAVLASYCNFLGLPASEVSAIAAANILMHYLKGGAFRVKGGIQNLITAFVKEIQSNGGKIYLGEGISEILCDSGVASGLKTEKGREVKAGNIVSNIDAKTVINSMVNSAFPDAEKIKRINNLAGSGSFVIIYLGMDYDLSHGNFVSSMGYFSSFDQEAMLNNDERLSFGVSIPSLIDNSVVPKGHTNIVIHWPFCYNNIKPDKKLIADKVIGRLEQFIPDIKRHIVYKSIADAETLYRYTGNHRGAAYGWAQDTALFSNLPFLKNLLRNFHIVGHWAGYGGGIMPAMLSAVRIARKLPE